MRVLRSLPFTFIISGVCLAVTVFCILGTMMGKNSSASKIEEKQYREMEENYVSEIRELLTEEGYENSGITMTWVKDETGERIYTVTIHHKRIDKLSDSEKETLIEECRAIEFPDKECGFFHKFLEEDL